MLLGKAAFIGILIIATSLATGTETRGEDGVATVPATPEPDRAEPTRATLDRNRTPKTTPTAPHQTKESTRAPFRGYAKFVNNIATTNQGYDYKPISVSSRKPSLRPMMATVTSGEQPQPTSPTSSNSIAEQQKFRFLIRSDAVTLAEEPAPTLPSSPGPVVKQQKLRLLIRPDHKKPTTKKTTKNSSEIVKTASSNKSSREVTSTAIPACRAAELKESQNETVVDSLDRVKENAGDKRVEQCRVSLSLGKEQGSETRLSTNEKAVESLEPASANGGNDRTNSSADDGDEDKKTLSQQVADGKYGLIHTELFSMKPTRPGILNYEINPEVPKDNVNNLGGLNAEEIWLAENHLLVLSGGGFGDQNSQTKWTPIDNYQAPRRQVKIPEKPKVPPPFPVQLTDNGPIEFLKDENGTEHRPPFFPPDFDPSAFPPPFPPVNLSSNGLLSPPLSASPAFPVGNFTPGSQFIPFPPPYPFPPRIQNDTRPLLPPRLPPNLQFLPPPGIGNGSEFDEDDPALYYPPPYDFYFPKDNHSIIPPGPLVPGIVLPPPPDFFARLNEKPKNKTKTKTKHRPRPNGSYLPPPPHRKLPHIIRPTTSTTTSTVGTTTTTKPIDYNDISTEYYFVQTTSPKTIADDITNEITQTTVSNPKYSLPVDDNDWMPIPAPIPNYITGPKKPIKANVIYTISQTTPPAAKPLFHGYTYENPQVPFKASDLELYYKPQGPKYHDQQNFTPSNFSNQINNDLNLVYPVNSDPQKDTSYISTTEAPSPLYDSHQFKHNFKDYFGNLNIKGGKGFLQSTTDLPYKSFTSSLRPYGKPKALEATYYFYEEPRETSDEYTDTKNTYFTKATRKPHQAHYPSISDGFASSTERPTMDHHGLSNLRSVTSTTTPAPEKYYYVADLNDADKINYDPDKYKSNIFGEAPKKPPKSEVSSKPIVEFSYIAPSYYSDSNSGHINDQIHTRPFYDKPKYVTTSKPTNMVYINSIRSTQSPLDDYFSTPKPPKLIKNVTRVVPTQQTPWYGFSKQQLATDNPYYAFFTHQDDGLIDDITKTYFTIFGQKIKATPSSDIEVPRKPPRPAPPQVGGPTPPLLLNGAVYSSPKPNYIDIPYQPVSNRPEHTTPNYDTSSEHYDDFANHYTTTRPPQIAFPTYTAAHQNIQFTTPKPFYGGFGTNNKLVPIKFSTPQPTVDSSNQHHHYNQRPIKIRPPILYNDELVNYKRPLPPINPDAEFIAPRPFRNNKFKGRPRLPSGTSQFISYRLPGNGGGHFYFLTPQEVRNFDSIDPLTGDNGEGEEKTYYKRDVH